MEIKKSRLVPRLAVAMIVALGICASVLAVSIYRLPVLGTERKSNVEEIKTKRITIPGESGFWVLFPTHPDGVASTGGSHSLTWEARQGLTPVTCAEGAVFDDCWGYKLSTIQGGTWASPKNRFQMVGKIYFHYKPVPKGTSGSVEFEGQAFIKDGATCAGDFTPAH